MTYCAEGDLRAWLKEGDGHWRIIVAELFNLRNELSAARRLVETVRNDPKCTDEMSKALNAYDTIKEHIALAALTDA